MTLGNKTGLPREKGFVSLNRLIFYLTYDVHSDLVLIKGSVGREIKC